MSEIYWSKAPDGTTHWDPSFLNWLMQSHEEAFVWLNGLGWSETGWQYPDDLSSMPRLVQRPESVAPAWDGQSFPPVGIKCEFQEGEDWWRVFTVGLDDDGHMVVQTKNGGYKASRNTHHFRPIRTAEQIKAEERIAGIKEIERIAQTGAHLDIPMRSATALWDAGYRKQEGV